MDGWVDRFCMYELQVTLSDPFIPLVVIPFGMTYLLKKYDKNCQPQIVPCTTYIYIVSNVVPEDNVFLDLSKKWT